MKIKRILSKQNGFLDYIALLMLFFLCIIVFSYMELGQTQIRSLNGYEANLKSTLNAESGAQDILSKFKTDALYDETKNFTTCPNNPEGKQYTVSLNGGLSTVCMWETEYKRIYIPVDIDGDGKVDFKRLSQRRLEIESVGTVNGKNRTVDVSLQLNIDSTGKISENILKWEQKNE